MHKYSNIIEIGKIDLFYCYNRCLYSFIKSSMKTNSFVMNKGLNKYQGKQDVILIFYNLIKYNPTFHLSI